MISVIMCIYKERLNWVQKAVESILCQTYQDIELIIVVDNPNIENEVYDYLKLVQGMDRRTKIYINEINMGPSESRNRGIHIAKGEFIAMMDGDDISNAKRLQMEYDFLIEHSCDVVASLYEAIDENDNVLFESRKIVKDINEILKYSNFMANSSLLMKKEHVIAVGGYRNFKSCEDYDLLLRLLSRGCHFGIINDYLIKYRVSENSRSNVNVLTTRNDYYYIQKLYKERKNKKTNSDSYSLSDYEKFLVKMPHTKKDADNYAKAQSYIEEGILSKKNPIKAFAYLIKAFSTEFCFTCREVTLRIKIMLA